MQGLGELLKTTREERGYTVDQVVHETNISRSYIEDLESERFENFPAEAYLIGFLRTYADYLGLEPEKIISLYKNHKLREEPSPIEALVGKRKIKISPLTWILGGVLILIVGAVVLLVPLIGSREERPRKEKETVVEEDAVRTPVEFTVEEELSEFHFMKGDKILFRQDDREALFTVSDMGNGLSLKKQDSPDHPGYFFSLGKEVFFSLFQDSPDYRISLKDYGFSQGGGILVIQKLPEQGEVSREDSDTLLDMAEITTAAPSGVQSRTVEPVVIYSAPSGERYTLDIKFRGYCLLRYKQDYEEPVQKYYKDGDTIRLEVNSRVELWLSNAGAVYGKINGEELDFGDAGEVSAKKIQWAKNESGQYELLLLHVY
ncbi:MAG: helix-turn-helix domain-containing protein [Spirochaetales bacterium]|nr:helix-turn-helix domain-containing protein [Spirochaetales bacterium]